VLAWKRGIAVLTAGPVKVTPDPRVRLLPSPVSSSSLPGIPELSGGGYSLELKDVRPQDAGDYACQMGTMEPREIIHTLEILGEDMLCLCLCLKTFVVVFFSLRDLPIVKLQSSIIRDVKIPLVTDSIINIFIDGADNIFI
jgi:hypothetical protein